MILGAFCVAGRGTCLCFFYFATLSLGDGARVRIRIRVCIRIMNDAEVFCCICSMALTLFPPLQREAHTNQCIDSGGVALAEAVAAVGPPCPVCDVDLGPLSENSREEHANRCADGTVLNVVREVAGGRRARERDEGEGGGGRRGRRGRRRQEIEGPKLCPDVETMLVYVGLERYGKKFAEEELDLEAMRLLGDDGWAEFKIPKAAERRIRDAISGAGALGAAEKRMCDGGGGEEEEGGEGTETVVYPQTQQFGTSGLGVAMARREGHLLKGRAGRFLDDSDDDDDDDEEPENRGRGDSGGASVDADKESREVAAVGDGRGGEGGALDSVDTPDDAEVGNRVSRESGEMSSARRAAARGFTQLESLLDDFGDDETQKFATGCERNGISIGNAAGSCNYTVGDSAEATPARAVSDSESPGTKSFPIELLDSVAKAHCSEPSHSSPTHPEVHTLTATPEVIEISPDAGEDADAIASRQPRAVSPVACVGLRRPSGGEHYGSDSDVLNLAQEESEDDKCNSNDGGSPAKRLSPLAVAERSLSPLPSPRPSSSSPKGRSVPFSVGQSEEGVTCPYSKVVDVKIWLESRRKREIERHTIALREIDAEYDRAYRAASDSGNSSPSAVVRKALGKRSSDGELCHGNRSDSSDDSFLDLTQHVEGSDEEAEQEGVEGDIGGGGAVAAAVSEAEKSSPKKKRKRGKGKVARKTKKTKAFSSSDTDLLAGANDGSPAKPKKPGKPRAPAASDNDLAAAIRGSPQLHDQLLAMEPVPVDDVLNVVKQAGFRISLANLVNFLSLQGVSYKVPPKPVTKASRKYLADLNSQQ